MTRARGLAWMAVPFAAYLAVLAHLWANAPNWDDYGSVLDSVLRMMDASSLRDWLGAVLAQHNEHRIATVRLVERLVVAIGGRVDFRVLILIGNLYFAGALILMWAEFRDAVPAPLFAAAAFLMFQWSYYEAAVWASGGPTNMGSLFFGFACLFLATRGRAAGAAACIACAVLATGCSASGLLALPLAALACGLAGRRARAWCFAGACALLWLLYFHGYVAPPNHPSPLVALTHKWDTVQLFLIVVGGVSWGHWIPFSIGVAILAVLAWLGARGSWREHPTAAAWVVFLIASAGAAAVGRVGIGVYHASRYAIFSTSLIVLAFLGIAATVRMWSRARIAAAILGAAVVSAAISWRNWDRALEFAIEPHLLAKARPATPGFALDPYWGMHFPNPEWGADILLASERAGLYSPREVTVHPFSLGTIAALPQPVRVAGHVDEVRVDGSRVEVRGWTDVPAAVPGRVIGVQPADPAPVAMSGVPTDRSDVARVLREPPLVFSGLRIDLDYASPADAQRAAAALCVTVEAPGHPAALLYRTAGTCVPLRAR